MGAQQVTLETSSAKTATGNSTETVLAYAPNAMSIEFDLTAASSAGGDTCDLFIQTKVLSNWVDIVRFTQVLGNGGTKRYFAKTVVWLGQAEFEDATALGAAAVRHINGLNYRVRWVIAGTGSFTFEVCAVHS